MKKFIFALFIGLVAPAISFADLATGPDFSNGFDFNDVGQHAPIILGIILILVIVGIVLIVKHFKKRNVDLSR